MKHKLWFNLVAIPTVVGSMLTMLLTPGVFATVRSATKTQVSCDVPTDFQISAINPHHNRGILIAYTNVISEEHPLLDFSAAESDAAVDLFGCDCPACLNVLRQLRNSPEIRRGQGHCWDNLELRVSRQQVREVLTNLEKEEALELKREKRWSLGR
ncbi:hypothetical protein [Chroogloeocystis siderophila]|jgi:hypothetical protein|uniref:Uncharacterized protein n=1 Tax=Chroogloeocystis siderophila 5.2 s.c.1 TaxID=247279 RepID=A0A1U7HXX0_9CHRO|nr:hypothetical protein [Chroogloeocystis siderophila]OKH28494.1 hypothetical protein NIES1031_04465 [Chroogloeocystis siderophila 5.2 s.c.1]